MQTCVCAGTGNEPKAVRRAAGLGLELAQPPSSDLEEFYPAGSGLKNALCRRVRAASEAVDVKAEIVLTPGSDFAPYLKAVRRGTWLRRKLQALIMEEGEVVWEHPPTLVPIALGTGEGWALGAGERSAA